MQPENSHPADKPLGIVIIILSALGACGGLALAGLGGFMGAAGGAAATQEGSASGAAAAGAIGGMTAIIGLVLVAVSVLNIVGGVGVMKSARWGFMLTGILSAISALLNLVNFDVKGILGLAIAAGVAVFCFMRLAGKLGPTPV
jgi:hypothetical protein